MWAALLLPLAAALLAGCSHRVAGSPVHTTRVLTRNGESVSITPLALVGRPSDSQPVVGVQLLVRNVGRSVAAVLPSVDIAMLDRAGHKANRGAFSGTAFGPVLPGGVKLLPGEATVGFVTQGAPAGFEVAKIRYDLGALAVAKDPQATVEWNASEIPTFAASARLPAVQPSTVAAIPAPARVGGTVNLAGQDLDRVPHDIDTAYVDTRLAVTLTRIVDPTQPEDPNDSNAVDKGNRLVAVAVRVRNSGPHNYFVAGGVATYLVDNHGQIYKPEPVLATTAGEELGTRVIKPGASLTGFVTFQIPDADTVAGFRYELGDGAGESVGRWTVK